jgi:AraC-like DNA-binding protein
VHLVDNYFMAAAFARSLPAFCKTRDLDINPAAERTGVDISRFKSNTAGISMTRFANLMELLSQQAADDCFGLNFAQFFRMGDSGPFGFCMMNAPNLEALLKNYERFIPLTADYHSFGVNYTSETVEIFWNYAPIIPKIHQYSDMMVTLTHRVLRLATGASWQPSHLHLTRAPPKSSALHRQVLCQQTSFRSSQNRIIFPSSQLSLPNPKSDSLIFTIMKEQCEVLLEKRCAKGPMLTELKKEILQRLQGGECNIHDIAAALSISERSLQRRLALKNTSFEVLVQETRKELAKALIEMTELPLAEVADRVGYSSLPAFSRAAKAWFGMPPSQARRNEFELHKSLIKL